jgi:hypothetical protein
VATINAHAPGVQFVAYIAALEGNRCDAHMLKDTIAGVKAITGARKHLCGQGLLRPQLR